MIKISVKKLLFTLIFCFMAFAPHVSWALSMNDVEDSMDELFTQQVCYKAVAENVAVLITAAFAGNEEVSGLISNGNLLTGVTMSISEKGFTSEALVPFVDKLYDYTTDRMIEGVIANGVKGLTNAGVTVPIQLQIAYFKYALDYARKQDVKWMLESFLGKAGRGTKGKTRISELTDDNKLDVVAGAILQNESKLKFYDMSGDEIDRKKKDIANQIVISFLTRYDDLVKEVSTQRQNAANYLTKNLNNLNAKLELAYSEFENEVFKREFENLPYFKMLRVKSRNKKPGDAKFPDPEVIKHTAKKWFVIYRTSDKDPKKRQEAMELYDSILKQIRSRNARMTEAERLLVEKQVDQEKSKELAFLAANQDTPVNNGTSGTVSDKAGTVVANLETILDVASEKNTEEKNRQESVKANTQSSLTSDEINKINTEGRTVPKIIADKIKDDLKPAKEHLADAASFDELLEKVRKQMKEDYRTVMPNATPAVAESLIAYYDKVATEGLLKAFESLGLNIFEIKGTQFLTWSARYTYKIDVAPTVEYSPSTDKRPYDIILAEAKRRAYLAGGPWAVLYYPTQNNSIKEERSSPHKYSTAEEAAKHIDWDMVKEQHEKWPVEAYERFAINIDGSDNADKAAETYKKHVEDTLKQNIIKNKKDGYSNVYYQLSKYTLPYQKQKENLVSFLQEHRSLAKKLKAACVADEDKMLPLFSLDLAAVDMDANYKKMIRKMIDQANHRQALLKKYSEEVDKLSEELKINTYVTDDPLPRPQKACYVTIPNKFSQREKEILDIHNHIKDSVFLYPRYLAKSATLDEMLKGFSQSMNMLDETKNQITKAVGRYMEEVTEKTKDISYDEEGQQRILSILNTEKDKLQSYEEDIAKITEQLQKVSKEISRQKDGRLKRILEASQELVKGIGIASDTALGYDSAIVMEGEDNTSADKTSLLEGWNDYKGYFVTASNENEKYDAFDFLGYKIKQEQYDLENKNISLKNYKDQATTLATHYFGEEQNAAYSIDSIPCDVKFQEAVLVNMIPIAVMESDKHILKKLPEFIAKAEQIRQAETLLTNLSVIYTAYVKAINEQIDSIDQMKKDTEARLEEIRLSEELQKKKEAEENKEAVYDDEEYSSTEGAVDDGEKNGLEYKAQQTLIAIFEAYENKDRNGVMRNVSQTFRSNNTTAQNYTLLEQSVQDDFRNLKNIRFNIYFRGLPIYYRDQGEIRINIDWNRRAEISRQGQEWLIDKQNTDFIFKVFSGGDIKLVEMQGNVPFGVSNEYGTVTITDGRIIEDGGRVVPVEEPIEIEYGQAKSSVDIRTSSVEEATISGMGWSFAAQGEVPNTSADFYWENNIATYDLSGDGGLLDMTAQFGYTDLAQVISIPDSGYGDYFQGVLPGTIFAVKTSNGKKGAIKITSISPTRMYFDYIYFE
ncbi:MAG: hypothetical protein KKC46_16770 [Proteobacteria bacterium]|nr:hypothetical protein [Pseudomonadota bacterium]